ncbi:MAG TPA: hypothetical protein VHZ52_18360 [Acidobacteriaceae bacterium]|jgi:hypothetical protein|nr:hypothetical protein [Acidobacteriaceae bacterium]
MASPADQQSVAAHQHDESAPRYLLVMTATIIPAASSGVRRADPQLRLEDYKRALRYWLCYEHPAADRILFLENSGADLSELRAIAADENPRGKPVEILSVPGNKIPEGRNYGYTEMQMLDEGLALSHLRQQTTHMVKTTGRLIFPALGKALNHIPKPFDLMVDCRKLGFPRSGYDASVQLFVCSHSFYDRVLRNSKEEMNSTDIRLLEHLIFRKVIPFKGQPGIHLRFPCNIEPVGYSGFKSRSYNSPRTALTSAIRAALRVVAPDYWF